MCRLEHQLCEDPECEGCFTAFELAEELDQHRRERHSGHMPRWNSRAGSRQMQVNKQCSQLCLQILIDPTNMLISSGALQFTVENVLSAVTFREYGLQQ